jgi:hypothetical protein
MQAEAEKMQFETKKAESEAQEAEQQRIHEEKMARFELGKQLLTQGETP